MAVELPTVDGRAVVPHTHPMTRNRRRSAVLLLLLASLVVACAGDGDGTEGDCNGRIGWDGTVYRPHDELNQVAPRGEMLGSGDVLDCDGSRLGTAVNVFAVDGVDSSVAITVAGSEWQGVYVAEGTPKSSWPDVLRGP
jgi:hypothetical protein